MNLWFVAFLFEESRKEISILEDRPMAKSDIFCKFVLFAKINIKENYNKRYRNITDKGKKIKLKPTPQTCIPPPHKYVRETKVGHVCLDGVMGSMG